jgi:hypothetical protein
VRGFRNTLTLLLAVLFPLVTIHCKLENLPAFQFLSCESDASASHESEGCEKDGCELLEGGFYKTEDCQVSTAADPLLSAETFLPETATLPSLSIPTNRSAATAPELPVTWQFSTRSAAPPRAPSFVS